MSTNGKHNTEQEYGKPLDDIEPITSGDEDFREKFVSWKLPDLTMTDIEEYLKEKDTVLVPMASTEQHGSHLPLDTDTITALEVSRRVAKKIGVLHTRPVWMGYSPHHMHEPGQGRGTITVRSSTLRSVLYDIGRSLIHHGFNRIIFVNGHGSNVKVIDPLLRELRYDTGALVSLVKPYMENYVGILEGLMENPTEETPGWHASELETSQDMAWNEDFVRMDRAEFTQTSIPDFLPDSFGKKDGLPDVEFEEYKYFTFPMEHHEFTETGVIGNPMRATAEKGDEAFRRLSTHVAKGILELSKQPVEVHTREFKDRV